MKSNPVLNSLFSSDREHPIRVIKAAQAGKALGQGHAQLGTTPHAKPEIRLLRTTPEYCDLEVVCGCGENTQVRCWNSPAAEAANAVAA